MQSPLATSAPFHFEATVRVLQRRPSNPVDVWEHDRYWRVLSTAQATMLVAAHNRGTINEPDLWFTVCSGNPSHTTIFSLGHTLRQVLGLEVDHKPIQRLAEGRRALRATALALRGMRPPRFVDLFEAFARVTPFQQMSLEARTARARRHPSTSRTSTVYTIGHSTRTVAEFVSLLRQVGVEWVVDVRSIPRSRTNPQFNAATLPKALSAVGIAYRHLRTLGGRRHRRRGAPPSRNTLWRNQSFRNYADYATTDEFRLGLDELRALIREGCCAVMCAEAVWWRCHRRIIADYLLTAGISVAHIMGSHNIQPARLTPGAQCLPDGTLVYPDDGSIS